MSLFGTWQFLTLSTDIALIPDDRTDLEANQVGVVPADLIELARMIASASKATSTKRVYNSAWKAFSSWCSSKGLDSLPASPTVVAAYISEMSRHGEPIAPNLRERDFAPAGPDHVWASDITYIRTWEGWTYLAVVSDLWSRRVIGCSMADHMRTELVLDALEMAVGQRVPEPNLIHSDRGSHYASGA